MDISIVEIIKALKEENLKIKAERENFIKENYENLTLIISLLKELEKRRLVLYKDDEVKKLVTMKIFADSISGGFTLDDDGSLFFVKEIISIPLTDLKRLVAFYEKFLEALKSADRFEIL